MKRIHLIALSALAFAAAGGAYAQGSPASGMTAMPAEVRPDPMAPAVQAVRPDQPGNPSARTIGGASSAAMAGVNASAVAPMGLEVPAGAATSQLAAGVVLISSPPVPDTPENRAKYGGPESNGGKRTAAASN